MCIRTGSLHLEDVRHSVSNLLATVADADIAAEVVQKTTELATSGEGLSLYVITTFVKMTDAATTVATKSGPFTAIANALESILKVILDLR